MTENDPILELDGLHKYFDQTDSVIDVILRRHPDPVQAVDDVSLSLYPNESIGIIGESGCGKTTLLMTLMMLHEPTKGAIRYRGEDITKFSDKELKKFRRNVQIIFQDPFNSLDPRMSVRDSLMEPLRVHGIADKERRVHEALEQAELRPPEQYLPRKPDQLSGGELQRVSIARALILEPDIILADEPVSMLDVSTQASVLNLLSELTSDLDVAMCYISHDLSTVSYVCDQINVMYLGRIVESAPTLALLDDPMHPYTRSLVEAIPVPDPRYGRERVTLSGSPGNPVGLGEGCRFRDRCPDRMDICEVTPIDYGLSDEHTVACHLHYDHEETVRDGEMVEPAHTDGGIDQEGEHHG